MVPIRSDIVYFPNFISAQPWVKLSLNNSKFSSRSSFVLSYYPRPILLLASLDWTNWGSKDENKTVHWTSEQALPQHWNPATQRSLLFFGSLNLSLDFIWLSWTIRQNKGNQKQTELTTGNARPWAAKAYLLRHVAIGGCQKLHSSVIETVLLCPRLKGIVTLLWSWCSQAESIAHWELNESRYSDDQTSHPERKVCRPFEPHISCPNQY